MNWMFVSQSKCVLEPVALTIIYAVSNNVLSGQVNYSKLLILFL
jgi:hypothetical protein